jgi:hypothetical protein
MTRSTLSAPARRWTQLTFAAVLILALAASGRVAIAHDDHRLVFTAFAVSTGGPRTAPVAETVTITIEQWTTPEQCEKLSTALEEGGADALLDELRDMDDVGSIRTPDSLAYPLHYAAQDPLPDGGRRIVLATDRPIRFWETWHQARTLDYPFTVIELRMDPDGTGEGKLALATRVIPVDGRIILENWSVSPIQLNQVRRESSGS